MSTSVSDYLKVSKEAFDKTGAVDAILDARLVERAPSDLEFVQACLVAKGTARVDIADLGRGRTLAGTVSAVAGCLGEVIEEIGTMLGKLSTRDPIGASGELLCPHSR